MSRSKPIPLWWFLSVPLIMIGIGFGVTQGYPTHLSWWAFVIALIMTVVWFVPVGIVQASTNIQIGRLVGYMQPWRPMAMMLFKTYGYVSMAQGLYFTQDMNLGAIKNVCDLHQANHFSCPKGRVFFNVSVIWGVIDPAWIYSPGQMYSNLMWFWLAGAILPVLIYFGARMFPRTPLRYLIAPLIFGGAGFIPPATPLNYLTWGIVGFVFNKWIRDRWRGWWMQYNYTLSAGLDVGLALSTIVFFLTLGLTSTPFPSWCPGD